MKRNKIPKMSLVKNIVKNRHGFYSIFQLYIIDGDELKDDPVTVMNKLQKYLRIEPFYDYNQKIR